VVEGVGGEVVAGVSVDVVDPDAVEADDDFHGVLDGAVWVGEFGWVEVGVDGCWAGCGLGCAGVWHVGESSGCVGVFGGLLVRMVRWFVGDSVDVGLMIPRVVAVWFAVWSLKFFLGWCLCFLLTGVSGLVGSGVGKVGNP
jgi:hypothetical protein